MWRVTRNGHQVAFWAVNKNRRNGVGHDTMRLKKPDKKHKTFYFLSIKRNISIVILLPFYGQNVFPYIRCDFDAGNDRVKVCTKSALRITLITRRNFITVQTLILERLSQNPCVYSKHWQQVSTLSSRRNTSLLISLPSSEFSCARTCSAYIAILDDSGVVWHPVGDTEHTRSLVPQCETSIRNTLDCGYYCIVTRALRKTTSGSPASPKPA